MNRETLWYKIQKKEVSEKFIEHVKRMYDEIQFWVNWFYEEMTEN